MGGESQGRFVDCGDTEQKEFLEQFASTVLAEAKDTSCNKKSVDSCLKQFKKLFGAPDPVFADCLATVLMKAPASRGGFDVTLLEHIDEIVAAKFAEYDGIIKSAEPAKDESAAIIGGRIRSSVQVSNKTGSSCKRGRSQNRIGSRRETLEGC